MSYASDGAGGVGHADGPMGGGGYRDGPTVTYTQVPIYSNVTAVTGTITTTTTNTYADTYEQDLGDTDIPICRPKFIFFKFENLRPNTAFWVFFDKKEVTKWVNTSYTVATYNVLSNDSSLLDPGEKYTDETGFPADLGGPTNSSGPIFSDGNGKIEGCFYLQSNAEINFSTGTRMLAVMDISVHDKTKAYSYAEVPYEARGIFDRYQIQVQYRTETSTHTEDIVSTTRVQTGTRTVAVTSSGSSTARVGIDGRVLLPGEPDTAKRGIEWQSWYRSKYGK